MSQNEKLARVLNTGEIQHSEDISVMKKGRVETGASSLNDKTGKKTLVDKTGASLSGRTFKETQQKI